MIQAKQGLDTVILHEEFVRRCLSFYSNVAEYLNSVAMPGLGSGETPNLPLPGEAPLLFAYLPEWYVEDIAEFLLFTLQ